MTPIRPAIRSMTHTECDGTGNYGSGLMLENEQRTYHLSAGTTDSIQVFQQGTILYVLTMNQRLTYVALDWYQGNEVDPVDGVFLQGDYNISEYVGTNWRDMTDLELARRLVLLFA